jgi:hypothetical protein
VQLIVGASAPSNLGRWISAELREIGEAAKHWSVDAQSEFFVGALSTALADARESWASAARNREYIGETLLPWEGWPVSQFREILSDCIVDQDAARPEIQAILTKFIRIDQRVGDPRLPANHVNWLGMAAKARQRVIEWLSRADIGFFFDHAFPRQSDRHRRKSFWLRYVQQVRMSRPLLNPEDRSLLRNADLSGASFGNLSGTSSAFVLDFGALCVIEFNRVGACYVFPRTAAEQIVQDLWTAELREADLKRRELLPDETYRVVHRPGWEDKLQRLLAIHGVRPS